MFEFSFEGTIFIWNGSLTVSVYDLGYREYDVFSLNWGKQYTKAEVMAAALEWIEEQS